MKNCPVCGCPVDDNQEKCLICGAVLDAENKVNAEEEQPSFRVITDRPVEEMTEEAVETAEETVAEAEETIPEETNEIVFESFDEEPAEEKAEEVVEEAEEAVEAVEEAVAEVEQTVPEETNEIVFESFGEEPAEEKAEETVEETEDSVAEVEDAVSEEENKEGFSSFSDVALFIDKMSGTDDGDKESAEEPDGDNSVPAATEETPDVAEKTNSDEGLSMVERIRKYQIIPDSLPIEDDEFKPVKPHKQHKVKEPRLSKAKEPAPIEAEELSFSESEEPSFSEVQESATEKPYAPVIKEGFQPEIKIQRPSKPVKKRKSHGKGIIIIIVLVALIIAAAVAFTNSALRSKISSLFGKEPAEQTEVVGNVSFKWVKGKKYSSDFDVLKIDQKELKNLIEESLRKNCTSEYNTLTEHYFGSFNGSDNYVGYIDTVGVGIIFELTDKDNLIKNIYVVADTSNDVEKGETLVSEYTACVLNALGEIDGLSYKNIGMYASSIKLNNFTTIATYTRYNNFILQKYTEQDVSALIINHGDDSTIKKFTQSEVLEIVNCADEKYLNEEANTTEPTTNKEVDVSKYGEFEVYEIKTAGDPLRIRKEPNTDSEVLGTFESGTQVEVFEIKDGWAKIIYNNEEAYLAENFIEKVEQE